MNKCNAIVSIPVSRRIHLHMLRTVREFMPNRIYYCMIEYSTLNPFHIYAMPCAALANA